MLYPQKNRYRRSYKKELALVVGILVLGSVFFSYFDAVLMRVIAPVWSLENTVSIKFWSMTQYFKSKQSLIEENESLKKQVESDALVLELNKALRNSRESLLNAYGRTSPGTGVAASVLVHPPVTPYDILVIDAGQNEGIKVGDSVTLPEGGNIGSVIETFDKTSKIRLYSTNGYKIGAVLERGNVPVELLGQGGGSFLFTLPREMPVEIGDRVLSSTVDSPLMGVVENVEMAPTDSFKKVLVRSVAPVFSLRFVLIEL